MKVPCTPPKGPRSHNVVFLGLSEMMTPQVHGVHQDLSHANCVQCIQVTPNPLCARRYEESGDLKAPA